MLSLVLVTIAASAQQALPPELRAEAARLDAAMLSVENYCREVDSFTKQNPPTLQTSDRPN
jgi:hypothetical protein